MERIELHKMKKEKHESDIATKWTYHTNSPRYLFVVRRSNYNEDVAKCPVERWEIVRLTYRLGWEKEDRIMYGVVTNVAQEYKYKWRNDYRVSVKKFDIVLDAIEYSEKKRAKYGNG